MHTTRVDALLIEMITPKIKEIEEKFSRGEGLTQDDIKTVLLKSQYNHINHLDDKLNEVTASVILLEGKFETLKTDLEGKFELLEQKFDTLKSDIRLEFEKSTNKMIIVMSTILTIFLGLNQFLEYLQR